MRRKDGDSYQANSGRKTPAGNYNLTPFSENQEQYFTPTTNRNYDAFSGQGFINGRRSPAKGMRGVENGSPVRRLQYR